MLNSTFLPANAHGPPEAISNALIFICDIIPYELIFISDHILFLAFSFILRFLPPQAQMLPTLPGAPIAAV
jgi:hypothetical protein